MSNVQWMTAQEIAKCFVVGAGRLLAHSRRGDLPCQRGVYGQLEFDADYAATLFRRRGIVQLQSATNNLGLLGKVQLGGRSTSRAIRRAA